MNGTRIVALALAAALSVLGMACEPQEDAGDPVQDDGADEATPTPMEEDT